MISPASLFARVMTRRHVPVHCFMVFLVQNTGDCLLDEQFVFCVGATGIGAKFHIAVFELDPSVGASMLLTDGLGQSSRISRSVGRVTVEPTTTLL